MCSLSRAPGTYTCTGVREARERLKAQESEDRFGPKPVASKPAPVSKPKAKPRDPPLMVRTGETLFRESLRGKNSCYRNPIAPSQIICLFGLV